MIVMGTSKTSRRRTEWIFCLAAWVMTALISFQAAPPGMWQPQERPRSRSITLASRRQHSR